MSNPSIEIRLLEIRQVEYVVREMPAELLPGFDHDKVLINVSFRFNFDFPAELFSVLPRVQYTTDNNFELLSFESEAIFKVWNLETVIKKNQAQVDIPDYLLVPTVSTSLSTARGMLVVKTAGTLLSKIILPIIDVNLIVSSLGMKNSRETPPVAE